jgi:hypothetical protein
MTGVHKFVQKYISHLKIVGVGMVTLNKFSADDPQILGATYNNMCYGELAPVVFAPLT